jgi:hypothetical protein
MLSLGMKSMAALMLLLAVSGLVSTTTVMAFAPTTTLRSTKTTKLSSPSILLTTSTTTTSLSARNPYNYNEGQSPWGLKTNGEIWNGRVAMVRSFFLFFRYQKRTIVGAQNRTRSQSVEFSCFFLCFVEISPLTISFFFKSFSSLFPFPRIVYSSKTAVLFIIAKISTLNYLKNSEFTLSTRFIDQSIDPFIHLSNRWPLLGSFFKN